MTTRGRDERRGRAAASGRGTRAGSGAGRGTAGRGSTRSPAITRVQASGRDVRALRSSVSRRCTSAAHTRSPGGGDPVVAAALVVERGVGTLVALLDQAVGEHALDRAVERARAHAHGAVGELLDPLHERVAVLLTVAERQQQVEHRRGQGLAAWFGRAGHRHSIDRRYIDRRYRCRTRASRGVGPVTLRGVAEGEGFEPSRRLNTPYSLSRRALSAAQSSLQ